MYGDEDDSLGFGGKMMQGPGLMKNLTGQTLPASL